MSKLFFLESFFLELNFSDKKKISNIFSMRKKAKMIMILSKKKIILIRISRKSITYLIEKFQ